MALKTPLTKKGKAQRIYRDRKRRYEDALTTILHHLFPSLRLLDEKYEMLVEALGFIRSCSSPAEVFQTLTTWFDQKVSEVKAGEGCAVFVVQQQQQQRVLEKRTEAMCGSGSARDGFADRFADGFDGAANGKRVVIDLTSPDGSPVASDGIGTERSIVSPTMRSTFVSPSGSNGMGSFDVDGMDPATPLVDSIGRGLIGGSGSGSKTAGFYGTSTSSPMMLDLAQAQSTPTVSNTASTCGISEFQDMGFLGDDMMDLAPGLSTPSVSPTTGTFGTFASQDMRHAAAPTTAVFASSDTTSPAMMVEQSTGLPILSQFNGDGATPVGFAAIADLDFPFYQLDSNDDKQMLDFDEWIASTNTGFLEGDAGLGPPSTGSGSADSEAEFQQMLRESGLAYPADGVSLESGAGSESGSGISEDMIADVSGEPAAASGEGEGFVGDEGDERAVDSSIGGSGRAWL